MQSQLDSLYTKFIQLNAADLKTTTTPVMELSPEDKKCGFGIITDIKTNLADFSNEQQEVINSILSRPLLQTSIVSPSGFFRIHYDATNVSGNLPSYVPGWSVEQNISAVAEALDSVYRFEIDFLGFLSPPPDNAAGGDSKYDVYVQNQGGGLYGYTEWESRVGENSWISFMVIDNDYAGYYSTGLDGMRVTVAHEFHHGVQLGNYSIPNSSSPFRTSDAFFFELTSTSMEEFVYDTVNDYYAYMDSYFRRTHLSLPSQNGYNIAIWNIYLVENFDFTILKRQWELITSQSAILSVNQTLNERGTSFPREMNRFGIWTFYTNFRRVPGEYFEESINYPVVIPTFNIQFPTPPPQMRSAPAANNFVNFSIPGNNDTLVAIVTNADAYAANQNPNQLIDFTYNLYNNPDIGSRELTDEYSADFSVSNPGFWSVSEILNNQLVREDSIIVPQSGSISYAYPNPFNYSKNYLTGRLIFFPLDANIGEQVDFNIYSISMQLEFSKQLSIQILPGDQRGISWNVSDNNAETLASGVYIYVVKNGDEIVTGKVVIFNE